MFTQREIDLSSQSSEDFWSVEHDLEGAFRWSKARFTLTVPKNGFDFVSLTVAGADRPTFLVVETPRGQERLELIRQWQVIDIPTHGALHINIAVDQPFQPENDARLLGVMVRKVLLHSDAKRH